MAGNQTAIPVIQSQDPGVTQLQQNANKVLRNIYNQLSDLATGLDQTTIVGEIKLANLTVAQFQSIAGTNWLLCNGQTCVGTTYSLLTGNKTVPSLTLGSVNNFIRIS